MVTTTTMRSSLSASGLLSMPPRWNELRKIGNSPAIRLTPLFPLVGYLILFNGALGPYLRLAEQFMGVGAEQQPPQIATKLLWIYLGLIFLALGSAIYAIFCPDDIKAHSMASDYVASEAPTVSQVDPIFERLRGTKFEARAVEATQKLAPRNLSADYALSDWYRDREIWAKGLLRIYFDYHNDRFPWARWATSIAFAVGFLALAWPSLLVFVKVVQLLL